MLQFHLFAAIKNCKAQENDRKDLIRYSSVNEWQETITNKLNDLFNVSCQIIVTFLRAIIR